ncbi:helix-turn-helix transcriptional regulator [Testudinibacter sp. TR-2022]|uniref:helix-turn-helix transcriptional regulator n=1 Tax=Testudinibacter sp. TR-2022 TaxID=2585029 RepID=UPI0011184C3E|nr:helix-turn-helix transcriptional regulator [Testudinibacter sp. TR-2022]TNH07885.1 AraC family transcriptional regulator [Pasteurellaceae bacterium Phil11]TNH24675.1 AraC family transcriptional regulator [Testudinibacter sp. TR-2022]TNH28163.1 AraC family transcriptional regulator [Testudinibacter sp. TR-2022]
MKAKFYQHIDPSPELLGIMNYREFDNGLAWKLAQLQCQPKRFSEQILFHPSLRLIFTLEGQTHLNYADRTITLNRGEGVILPNLGCEIQGNKSFYAGYRQKELVLFFEPEWIDNIGIDESLFFHLEQRAVPHQFKITGSIELLIRQLMHSEDHPTQWQTPIQNNLCTTLLLEVMQTLFPPQISGQQQKKIASKRLERLLSLLHDEQTIDWNMKQIAQYCCSNTTTLQREFKEHYNTTIMNYLRQIKMQRAKHALLGGALVSEAAQLAGYRKIECFSQQFYNQFGIYPSKIK